MKKAFGHLTYSWYNTNPECLSPWILCSLCHEQTSPTKWPLWSFYHWQHVEHWPLKSSAQHSPLRTFQEAQPGTESLSFHMFFLVPLSTFTLLPIYQSKLQLTSPIPNLTMAPYPRTWKEKDVWNIGVDLRKQTVSKDRVTHASRAVSSLLSVKLKEGLIELSMNRSLNVIQDYYGYFSV